MKIDWFWSIYRWFSSIFYRKRLNFVDFWVIFGRKTLKNKQKKAKKMLFIIKFVHVSLFYNFLNFSGNLWKYGKNATRGVELVRLLKKFIGKRTIFFFQHVLPSAISPFVKAREINFTSHQRAQNRARSGPKSGVSKSSVKTPKSVPKFIEKYSTRFLARKFWLFFNFYWCIICHFWKFYDYGHNRWKKYAPEWRARAFLCLR